MKDYFINYSRNYKQEDHSKLIDQKCQIIFTKYDKYKYIPIEWFTISNTKVRLDLIMTGSKLTAKSNLFYTYSFYIPQDLTKTESSVEIFANSRGTFNKISVFIMQSFIIANSKMTKTSQYLLLKKVVQKLKDANSIVYDRRPFLLKTHRVST